MAGAALAVAVAAATVGPVAAERGCRRLCERVGGQIDDSRWERPPEFGNSILFPLDEPLSRLLDGTGAGLLEIFGRELRRPASDP